MFDRRPLNERSWLSQAWWAWSRVMLFNLLIQVCLIVLILLGLGIVGLLGG